MKINKDVKSSAPVEVDDWQCSRGLVFRLDILSSNSKSALVSQSVPTGKFICASVVWPFEVAEIHAVIDIGCRAGAARRAQLSMRAN